MALMGPTKSRRIAPLGSPSLELPDLFLIEKGLTGNEKIILDGIRMVKDGDEIETEFIDPKSVIGNLSLYTE